MITYTYVSKINLLFNIVNIVTSIIYIHYNFSIVINYHRSAYCSDYSFYLWELSQIYNTITMILKVVSSKKLTKHYKLNVIVCQWQSYILLQELNDFKNKAIGRLLIFFNSVSTISKINRYGKDLKNKFYF